MHQSKLSLALSPIWQFMVKGKENSNKCGWHYNIIQKEDTMNQEGKYYESGNNQDLVRERQNQTKPKHKTKYNTLNKNSIY